MTVCGEKVTGVCVAAKCPHFKRCFPVVWDKYGKIKPKTNEEWFCSLPTDEKADFLANIYPKSVGEALIKISNGDKEKWEEWLKEKHNGKT
jgi:hypothetical protein